MIPSDPLSQSSTAVPKLTSDERARAVLAALGMAAGPSEPLAAGLSSNAWRVHGPAGDAVLRLPVEAEDGVGTYPIEHALLARLTAAGTRVPAPIQGSWLVPGWQLDPFSLTSFVPGSALRPGSAGWAAEQIAGFLRVLHGVPVRGFGPLMEADGRLAGQCAEPEAGLMAAFAGRPLWPFGGTRLDGHPAHAAHPDLLDAIAGHAAAVRRAALKAPTVIVHSDLHEENILEDGDRLWFIDFGECFVGAGAWDLAAIAYFGGWPLAERVLAAYLEADDPRQPFDGRAIPAVALSFGLYRWHQDRDLGVDGDDHDEAFLRQALARFSAR